jgi:hypothetical protein
MTGFVEPLIWLGVGTIWGLVFAAIFYLIARYLDTRDARKGAKKGGTNPAGKSAHPLGAYSPECVEEVFCELRVEGVLRSRTLVAKRVARPIRNREVRAGSRE